MTTTTPAAAESTSLAHPFILRPWEARAFVAGRKTRVSRLVTHVNSTWDGCGRTLTRWAWPHLMFDGTDEQGRPTALPGVFLGYRRGLFVRFRHPGDTNPVPIDWLPESRIRPRWEVGDTIWGKEAAYITPPNWGDADLRNVVDRDGRGRMVGYSATMDGEAIRCAEDYVPRTPSIHLPRWATRITLTVRDVDAHRMQDVTPEQVIAEGVFRMCSKTEPDWWGYDYPPHGERMADWRDAYRAMCEATHGAEAWDKDGWLWSAEVGVEVRGR